MDSCESDRLSFTICDIRVVPKVGILVPTILKCRDGILCDDDLVAKMEECEQKRLGMVVVGTYKQCQ